MKNANMKSFIYSLCFTIVTNIQHFKFSDFKLRVDMQGNDSESTLIACCAVCTLCSCEGCQGREGKESQDLNNCRAERHLVQGQSREHCDCYISSCTEKEQIQSFNISQSEVINLKIAFAIFRFLQVLQTKKISVSVWILFHLYGYVLLS